MQNSRSGLRQLVDWRAAIIAGFVAGMVFLLLNVIAIPLAFGGGSGWIIIRYLASIVMGPEVLPPPDTFDLSITVVALLVNFSLSLVFALILAFITHRWGLIIGIILGGLLGLALYGINLYTFTLLVPWFFALNSPFFAAVHFIFGAVAGGVYEAIEVERFVPVESTP